MRSQKSQRGVTLIELMVAMAIGVVLIGGALYVFTESRAAMQVSDSLSRMQENARFALNTIEPDIRMAGFWGLHNESSQIVGRTNAAGEIAPMDSCGIGWAMNLDVPIEGFNAGAPPWVPPWNDCIGDADHQDNTDLLAVRHARRSVPANLQPGRIYIRSDELPRGELFIGDAQPASFSTNAENHQLETHAYFVSPSTFAGQDTVPSLRQLVLTDNGNAPIVENREIINGVEDMQIQFGIDTDVRGAPGRHSVNRYVNADNPLLDPADPAFNPDNRIIAVRIWLLMRSDTPELGFTDDRTYVYGDREFTPEGADAEFRRLLVSRTIFLRNLPNRDEAT
ncbi:MAG: PilW family protein [Pseudomonadota bacterium]